MSVPELLFSRDCCLWERLSGNDQASQLL